MNYFPNGHDGKNFQLTITTEKKKRKKEKVQMIGQQGIL